MNRKKGQSHFVFIRNGYMVNQILHLDRKCVCRYYLQSFSTEPILERTVNACFKIDVKQMIKMVNKGEVLRFEKYTWKVKQIFIIYFNFQGILLKENNES